MITKKSIYSIENEIEKRKQSSNHSLGKSMEKRFINNIHTRR